MSKIASSFTHSSYQHHLPYRSIIAIGILALFGSLMVPPMWKQSTMEQSVKYVEIPSGRENVKRYEATQHSSGDPISILSWMTIVSSNSSVGIQAASDLSDIIVLPLLMHRYCLKHRVHHGNQVLKTSLSL